jgi:hypothetical protein
VGDSFTSGIGSPYQHMWTQVLQSRINRRTINISMDGASNEWIARRAVDIMRQVRPRNLVIMWSYLHRRESTDESLDDLGRRQHHIASSYEEDVDNFFACVDRAVRPYADKVIHGLIPRATSSAHTGFPLSTGTDPRYNQLFQDTKFVGQLTQQDRARDGHHFDIVTASQWVDGVVPLLTL